MILFGIQITVAGVLGEIVSVLIRNTAWTASTHAWELPQSSLTESLPRFRLEMTFV